MAISTQKRHPYIGNLIAAGDCKIAFLHERAVVGDCEGEPDLWLGPSAVPIGLMSVCWQIGHTHSDISVMTLSLPCKLGLSKQATCMCSNVQWLPYEFQKLIGMQEQLCNVCLEMGQHLTIHLCNVPSSLPSIGE